MAAPAQPPMGGPPQDFGPPGPISTGEVRILYLLVQIQHGLGRMEEAIGSLKAATDSHNEEIKRLIERTIKAETTLASVDKTVDRHHADLDGLGTRHNKDVSEVKNDLNDLGRKLEIRLNETAQRIENGMNLMGRRLEEQIREPDRIAHTVASFGKFALALIAGGGLMELFRILITHHW